MAAFRQKSRSHGCGRVLLAAAVGVALVKLSGSDTFCPGQVGLNRKQQHGSIHNKDKLGDVVEVPLEEEEPEAPPKPPMPMRRVPYSLNIFSQFPNGKHLGEDTTARKYIEEKITGALENFEDQIRAADVHLHVSENFHRKDGVEAETVAPYIFKTTITLASGKRIIFSNPEKHAQPTLQAATDDMIDVLRKNLRAEKEKTISLKKKERNAEMPGSDEDDQDDIAAEEIAQAAGAADAVDEQLYKVAEASS